MIGNNRPNFGDTRPNISVNRPVIGGSRPNIGNSSNINIGQIGNNNVVINRPSWGVVDPGFSRPHWGLENDWHHHWYDNAIHHHHHGWYNGCWHGHWGSEWYAPLAWGAIGWGLGAWTASWGNAPVYYNPYYAQPIVAQSIPYDYSQPVIINNTISATSDDGGQATAPGNLANEQGLAAFDEGLASFKAGKYDEAVSKLNSALALIPTDPVVHELRSLALFAVGDYSSAAAGLNSLLAAAPGMDWTTMSGLYGNIDDYTSQLRKLESYTTARPTDAAAHFVLAYHYLVMDAKDEAIAALRVVIANQPKDATAKRMLDALVPDAKPQVGGAQASAANRALPTSNVDGSSSTTDLVGTWRAQAGDSQIELTISENSTFTWTVTRENVPTAQLSGNISGDAESIELVTAEQGTMGGTVTSNGPDAWVFSLEGAPKSEPGLHFARVE